MPTCESALALTGRGTGGTDMQREAQACIMVPACAEMLHGALVCTGHLEDL